MPTLWQHIFYLIKFLKHCVSVSVGEPPIYAHVKLRLWTERTAERKSLVTSTSPKLKLLTILSVMRLHRLSSLFARNSTSDSYRMLFHVLTVHSLRSLKRSFISSVNFCKCEYTSWSDKVPRLLQIFLRQSNFRPMWSFQNNDGSLPLAPNL
jgi:hypothetical protein